MIEDIVERGEGVNETMYKLIAVAGGGGGGPADIVISLLPMVAIFAIFYFLVIRPQKTQQRNHDTYVSNLKSGDKVITQGGMLGRVVAVQTRTVTLELGNGKVKVLRTHISGPQGDEKESSNEKSKTEKK